MELRERAGNSSSKLPPPSSSRRSRTPITSGCSAVNKPDMFPLPVALALLRSAYSSESYGPIMAGAALSAVPLLVVFLVANRRIVEGVRLSGLKG